jgi:hypothetical protein
MSKVPIETLPVELRIKIYELGDVSDITSTYKMREFPWARTILMSGILNDKDAIEIAAIQEGKCRKVMCSYLSISGNLPMIKWVQSDKSQRKDGAAEERSMKPIRLTPLFPWDEESCSNASRFGRFKLLKWLHEQGCPWNHRTFDAAAAFGDLEMLEWLYQEKCPWDRFTCYMAAYSGNFDVLKWLHERNCPWDSSCYESAIRSGNFDIVVWLHEKGCPWNEAVCAEAAEGGHLEILQNKAAHGMKILVLELQEVAILRS